MKTVFVSHSAKGDRAAMLVAERLLQALASDGSVRVFLDTDALRLGQTWRLELHRQLAQCHGSVILLSEKALRSEWVLKEATLLAFFATFRSDVERRVVPVLLGGVTKEDISRHGFGPLRLDDFQCLELPCRAGESDETYAARVTDEVVRSFDGWATVPIENLGAGKFAERWFTKICAQLKNASPGYLRIVEEKLGIAESLEAMGDRCEAIAHSLVNADLPRIESALRTIRHAAASHVYEELVSLVTPVWIPHASVRSILPAATGPDSRRFILLNSDCDDTATEYVMRATCCDEDVEVMSISFVRGEDEVAALQEIDDVVRMKLGYLRKQSAEDIRRDLEKWTAPVFMLVSSNLCCRGMLMHLRNKYPKVTFLLLSADHTYSAADLGVDGLMVVEPPLDEETEANARATINRVRAPAGTPARSRP